jgi:protein TorT
MKNLSKLLGAVVMAVVMTIAFVPCYTQAQDSKVALEPLSFPYYAVKGGPKNCTVQEKIAGGAKVTHGTWVPPEPATKPWKIGILFPHMKDSWMIFNYGAMREVQRLGVNATLLSAGSYDNLQIQLSQMEDLVSKGVDIILLSPISLDGNNALTEKIVKQGIPVIEVVNDMTSEALLTKCEVSFWQMGYQAGKGMLDDIKKRGLKEANTVFLPGPAGAGWAIASLEGFKQCIKEAPVPIKNLEVKWGDTGKEVQMALIEDLLSLYGDKINYIVGCAPAASAGIYAVRNYKLADKIKLISTYVNPMVADHIKKGNIIASPTEKGCYQYTMAVGTAVNYLEGRIKAEDIPDVMGPVIENITPENYDKFPMESTLPPKGWKPVFEVKAGEVIPFFKNQ